MGYPGTYPGMINTTSSSTRVPQSFITYISVHTRVWPTQLGSVPELLLKEYVYTLLNKPLES